MFYLSDLFDNDLFSSTTLARTYSWKKTDSGIRLYVELPGVDKEALTIEAEADGALRIVAVRRGEWEKDLSMKINVGSRYDLDSAKAELRDGLLTIDLTSANKKRSIRVV